MPKATPDTFAAMRRDEEAVGEGEQAEQDVYAGGGHPPAQRG
jgi:hypothetical protein